MTVFYTDEISDGDNLTVTCKLLRKWKGSLYKLVWSNLLIYVCLYYTLSFTYRFALTENQKRLFEQLVDYCDHAKENIPISFLLGFFVSGIVGRWFFIFPCIPWMNRVALDIASCVNAKDEVSSRKIRITLMRYVNLAWILLLRLMSDQTSNRFSVQSQTPKSRRSHHHLYHPWSIAEDEEDEKRVKTHRNRSGTLNSPSPSSPSSPYMEAESFTQFNAFEAADDKLLMDILKSFNNDERVKNTFGVIITKDEINAFQSIASDWYTRTKTHYTPEYWVPIQWAQRLTIKALQSEYITEPRRAYHLIYQLNKFRDQLQYLQIFSSMMVPLAYAQVVTIAVYTYFTCQLFSSQFVERRNGVLHSGIDLYVPVFDFLSYLFLMGWYKVALCVINPFGDDDEDFQIGDILDYNLETSFRSVYMDPQSFPKTFSAPLYGSEDQVDRSKAEFQKFLDSINPDLWMDLGDPESPKDSRISSHPNSRPSCLSSSGQKLCTTTFSAFRICGR